jgi:hypothetical protein
MRTKLLWLGPIALAVALGSSRQAEAAAPYRQAVRDVNCSPSRATFLVPYGGWPVMPMVSPYAAIAYRPPIMPVPVATATSTQLTTTVPQTATTQRPAPYVMPKPSGISASRDSTDAPAEAAVRMRYIELSVSGVESAGDSATITAALDKLQGSRGSSLKRKSGAEATVKVWYSEKEPIEADAVIETVTKLGFKATLAG